MITIIDNTFAIDLSIIEYIKRRSEYYSIIYLKDKTQLEVSADTAVRIILEIKLLNNMNKKNEQSHKRRKRKKNTAKTQKQL